MAAFTRFLFRYRLAILAAVLLATVAAGVLGRDAVSRLKPGGFEDPDAASSRAATALRDTFGVGDLNLVLLVTAKHGTVDHPAVVAEGRRLTRRLEREPDAAQVTSYWTSAAPTLRSSDHRQALIVARIDVEPPAHIRRVDRLAGAYEHDGTLTRVQLGGSLRATRDIDVQVQKDLARAESIAVPLTLLLLAVVFASAVAGVLPLAVGGFAVIGTLAVLRGLASLTDVSLYTLNLISALGLGLAIDYSLLIVSRYREELRNGAEPLDALVVTMSTAGRTTLFSALTVAASLLALLIFPLYFLRSFGYAGIAVVGLAAVGALVLLPALLALLGRNIDRLGLPLRRRPVAPEQGAWHRIALTVMRHPLPITVTILVLLLVLGAPFLGVKFGLPDDRVIPPSAPSRQVSDAIREHFAANDTQSLSVVALGLGDARTMADKIDGYARRLSALEGVAQVDALTGSYQQARRVAPPGPQSLRFAARNGTWLSVTLAVDPFSPAGEDVARGVWDTPRPFAVEVTGNAARLLDTKASLAGRLPPAIAIIAMVTFALLFLLTGSVVIPVKAVILNLLSLTAVYGAIVWVFQEGHLAGVLGFTPTGTIDTSMPVLLFCIVFGLSMDYEIFLLGRIKEEHDRTGDTRTAVAVGLERTGRIVTAAAVLLAIVLASLGTSRVSPVQLLGLGAALAIVVDATLIRALLVPAFMQILGRANWWAPRPLRRLHDRVMHVQPQTEPPRDRDQPAPQLTARRP
jgi:putative drug exporter of the RND superfamily